MENHLGAKSREELHTKLLSLHARVYQATEIGAANPRHIQSDTEWLLLLPLLLLLLVLHYFSFALTLSLSVCHFADILFWIFFFLYFYLPRSNKIWAREHFHHIWNGVFLLARYNNNVYFSISSTFSMVLSAFRIQHWLVFISRIKQTVLFVNMPRAHAVYIQAKQQKHQRASKQINKRKKATECTQISVYIRSFVYTLFTRFNLALVLHDTLLFAIQSTWNRLESESIHTYTPTNRTKAFKLKCKSCDLCECAVQVSCYMEQEFGKNKRTSEQCIYSRYCIDDISRYR